MKLLVAEDTVDMNRALTAVLGHDGYDVDPVYDGGEALAHIERDAYDGIILDIMMPVMSGLDVLRHMRQQGIFTPVLLLTARAEVDDRVEGLDAGADDYLTKPFAMKELLARVRAMTRRRMTYSVQDLTFGDIRLKADGLTLTSENTVRLSIREFELMQLLITAGGKPLGTETILMRLWASEPDAGADTVWLYISYLRRKLEAVVSTVTIRGGRGGSFYLEAGA